MQPLACILGNGGEVFFPKLGVEQMLTFSSNCDKFVAAEGFEKKECGLVAETEQYASFMGDGSSAHTSFDLNGAHHNAYPYIMKRSLNDITPVATSHNAGMKRVLLSAQKRGCGITQIAITDLRAVEVAEAHARADMQKVFYVLSRELDIVLDGVTEHC